MRQPLLAALACGLVGACAARPPVTAARPTSLQEIAAGAPAAMAVAQPDRATPAGRRDGELRASLPIWAGARGPALRRELPDGYSVSVPIGGSREAAGRDHASVAVKEVAAAGGQAIDKPGRDGIAAELADRFPGVAMKVVAQPRRNAYGPYGLAVGLSPEGLRCLYAWQWVDGAAVPARPALGASLRVRLCRADLTFDAMAAAVDKLVLARDGAAHPGIRRIATARHRPAPQARTIHQPRDPAPSAIAGNGPGPRYLAEPDGSRRSGLAETSLLPAPPGAAVPAGMGALVDASRSAGALPPEAFAGPRSAQPGR